MGKFLLSFNHMGYCIHIDDITEHTDIKELIKQRQGLEPEDDLDEAYGFWDIKEGTREEFEDAAIIRNCYLDMQDGCECVCGCHKLPAY